MTLTGLFERSVAAHRRDVAMRHWTALRDRALSSDELMRRVARCAAGLRALGIRPGERVLLICENRPEWAIVDYATQFTGGVLVPVYPSLTIDQIRYILENSEAACAVASTQTLVGRVCEAAASLRHPAGPLRHIVAIDEATTGPDVIHYRSLLAMGDEALAAAPESWRERAASISPDDIATIIYTSGTTGTPKGVMLSHRNIVSNVETLCEVLDFSPSDTALSFLPLCHITQRIADYCFFHRGVTIVHVPLEEVSRALAAVRPTTFPGVPRVFEKARDAILARVARQGRLRRRLATWALGVAAQALTAREAGRPAGAWDRLPLKIADRLVLERIRDGLGGRLRWVVCGGAPLRADVMRFFLSIGVPILEGYGLTETGVLTINRFGSATPGSVGPALPGVRIRIDDDGEVLAAGPGVSHGYFRDPDRTAASFRDGWFHTGDLGRLDETGRLAITGRKKDLLVTSGGKKVAPAPIEQAILASGLVAQAVLVGDRRKYVTALLVPDRERLLARCRETGIAANGSAPWDALLRQDPVRAMFRSLLDEVNGGLARFEQIKDFVLMEREFTQEAGEMTPTLKLRRSVIEEKYRDLIASLYEPRSGDA